MCQCQQNPYNPYASPVLCPYCTPPVYAIPYPSLTVYYDPYWPSKVSQSTNPIRFVPNGRFRGEVRVGNCLMIYE